MKNFKTKIIIASLAAMFGMFGISQAASLYLDVTPVTSVKNVGNSFNISVNVNTDGSYVYAVEGTITLNNLTCKSIVIADGLVWQSVPTCSNPYFLIGVPAGTNVNKALFRVLVDGASVGNASILITNVDIMGAGQSLSSLSVGGQYKIEAPAVVPVVASNNNMIPFAPTSTPATSTVSTSSEVVPAMTIINPDNKGNGFVATVLESLSSLSLATKITLSALLALIVLGLGPVILRKSENQI